MKSPFYINPPSVEHFTTEEIRAEYERMNRILKCLYIYGAIATAAFIICLYSLDTCQKERDQWKRKCNHEQTQDQQQQAIYEQLKNSN